MSLQEDEARNVGLFGHKPKQRTEVAPRTVLDERAGGGETMLCSGCGQELGYDREDEPNGDGPGRHVCGECNRARNFDAELEMMWRNGDL